MGLFILLGTGELVATKTKSKLLFKSFPEKVYLKKEKNKKKIKLSLGKSFPDNDLDLTGSGELF